MFYNNTYYMSHCIINKSKTSKISSRLLNKHCMHHNHTSCRTFFSMVTFSPCHTICKQRQQ